MLLCVFGNYFCWANRLVPHNSIKYRQEHWTLVLVNNFLPLEKKEVYRLVFVLAQDTVVAQTSATVLMHTTSVQDLILWDSNSDWLSKNRLRNKCLIKSGSMEFLVWWEFLSWNCWMLVQGALSTVWQKHWHCTNTEDKHFGWELPSFLIHLLWSTRS